MGFTVMDEGFMSQPATLLHPQSLLMETLWVCAWFQRLMTHISGLRERGEDTTNKVRCCAEAAAQRLAAVAASRTPPHTPTQLQIIIADRSPLSAVFYSRSEGKLLEPLIRQYTTEMREVADVHVHTVHLRTERELLWDRITARLEREPSRVSLGEDRREWMEKVLAFYDSMAWDLTVPNNSDSVVELMTTVMTALTTISEPVKVAVDAHSHVVRRWRTKSMASLLEAAAGADVLPARPLAGLMLDAATSTSPAATEAAAGGAASCSSLSCDSSLSAGSPSDDRIPAGGAGDVYITPLKPARPAATAAGCGHAGACASDASTPSVEEDAVALMLPALA